MSSNQATTKTLVIAEKPSVAGDLAKALGGKFQREKTHYENEEWVISWAIGHLVTIAEPRDMDERWKGWKFDVLPMIPSKFALKPIENTKSQLNAIARLAKRKDIATIVNACDAGREGELIFHYILQQVFGSRETNGKKILRLWMQSMTPTAIRNAFAHLRGETEMHNLQEAALSRSEADWLVGINGSRGLTAYNSRMGGFQLTPCGRVQTPTLAMIVRREQERLSFVPKDFWTVQATFDANGIQYQGRWFNPEFRKEEGNSDENAYRIWDSAKAQAIADAVLGKQGSFEESSKPQQNRCPPLYDLTSLQREANGRFGFSARMTLQIAQALYERHKAATYPRTDSKFLPTDYLGLVKETLGNLSGTSLGGFAKQALDNGWIRKDPRIFDDTKISDHHAIIPTGVLPKSLSEPEAKVYQMIVQRFIAVFFPSAVWLQTVRTTTVAGEPFRTEGKVLQEPGWRAVYGKEADEESALPALPTGAKPLAQDATSQQDHTRPPARFNESTLLSLMESAGKLVEDEDLRDAMKDRGLGTPATRAAIIEKLIADRYIVREGKDLAPTTKGFDLIRLTEAMRIEDLTQPELTGEWEYKLGLVERGKYTRSKFMGEIEELTRRVVERIKSFDEEATRRVSDISPVAGRKVFETVSRWENEDGVVIRKLLGGRSMAAEEARTLFENGSIGPLDGFRSRLGRPFSASLKVSEKKVDFVFPDRDERPAEDLASIEGKDPIGVSPIDGSPVFELAGSYSSKSALERKKTGLRVNKTILGAELKPEDIVLMLSGERSSLIKGFLSSRTKRPFDAWLRLDTKGKLRFEFPDDGKARRGRRGASGDSAIENTQTATSEGAPATQEPAKKSVRKSSAKTVKKTSARKPSKKKADG